MAHDPRRRANTAIGAALIGLGALFMLGRVLNVNAGAFLWPFFIIIPGLMFFVGMLLIGKPGGPLAIPGSIVTVTGTVLLYQSILSQVDSDAFASWAYVWALIFPTAVGIGLIINGMWSDDPRLVRTGTRWTIWGLGIFLLLGAFFELLLNLTDNPLSDLLWPALLIGLGIWLLRRNQTGMRGRHAVRSVAPTPEPPAPPAPPAEAPPKRIRTPKSNPPPADFEPLDPSRGKK